MPSVNRSSKKRLMAEINVVPYIDVMLVLLVIFMITAPLLSQGVHVALPQASAKPLTEGQDPLIVSVDAQGRYYLNAAENPTQALEGVALQHAVALALQAGERNKTPRTLLVKADKTVPYGTIMVVMTLLQQAGAQSIGLVTEPNPQVNGAGT